jgi:hypothetical protein
LHCVDAKQTCFFPAWLCGWLWMVAWVIIRLHNTCLNSLLIH